MSELKKFALVAPVALVMRFSRFVTQPVVWALLHKYPEVFWGLLVQWATALHETQAVQTAGQSDAER